MSIKIIAIQSSWKLGDINNNLKYIIQKLNSIESDIDLVVFPELALTGYPLEDLVQHIGFQKRCDEAIQTLEKATEGFKHAVLLSHPVVIDSALYNGAILIQNGEARVVGAKKHLPNYGVFDEERTFKSNNIKELDGLITIKGVKIGVMICEDAWYPESAKELREKGAELLVSINASPYDLDKHEKRHNVLSQIAKNVKLPIIYLNAFAAEDDLIFDGGSCVTGSIGQYVVPPIYWEEKDLNIVFENNNISKNLNSETQEITKEEHIYNALILGLRRYYENNRFEKVLVALSGGIDSALVAAIAVDAIGSENVIGVRLPSKYSSTHSLVDAADIADRLKIELQTIPIQGMVDSIMQSLQSVYENMIEIVEQNCQARTRGSIMMGLSNQTGALLLSTGNKSEYACGYATLYGDMCGGFAPIKDVYKTQVYGLALYRNSHIPKLSLSSALGIIPNSSITKPPSAELSFNQLDSHTLPEYDILDKILYKLIEQDMEPSNLLEHKIYKMVRNAEYKRRQSAPGTKISIRSFGKDRRYPITNCYSSEAI